MNSPDRHRVRPWVALRTLRQLLRNPDDTALVFQIIDALKGRHELRMLARMRASASGAQVLERSRELLASLSDRDALRRLPAGSLGRAYVEFMDREQISAEGLVSASEQARGRAEAGNAEAGRLRRRLRDSHDLWHVVTGYDRDLVGEAALLAFTYAQTRNRGIGFIVIVAWLRAPREIRRLIRQAFRRGARAAWLPAVDWEARLGQPLEEVRAALGLERQAPVYVPRRSAGAPAAPGGAGASEQPRAAHGLTPDTALRAG